jgi:predicted nucleic acid-binding protein
MIICDTDVMIDMLRGHAAALDWFSALGNQTVALPGLVMMELLQGCKTKTEQQRMQKLLRDCPLLWPSSKACGQALKHFSTHYLSHGTGIIDALIAETAIEAGYPLHTFNQKHYQPHTLLKTIQPYSR